MTKTFKALRARVSGVQNKLLSLPVSLRTTQDELTYILAKKTSDSRPLIDEPRLKEWNYWALIDNKFPYSAAFTTHHMLIPKRRVSESKLTQQERTELRKILDEVSDLYDCHMTNFISKQSVRDHYHIHLLTYKDQRKELDF